MPINFKPFSHFILLVGMKGSGKTTLTIYLCKSLNRLIFIDPTWQVGILGYVVHYPERILPAYNKFHKVIYQPKKMSEDEYRKAFEVCLSLQNYTLGIDEVDKFARPRWYLTEEVNELINRGRAQGIGLVCNTRRPHMIHNDIRSNADYVVSFKLHEERDCKYVGDWLGIDPQRVKELKPFHSWLFDVGKLETTQQLPLDVRLL